MDAVASNLIMFFQAVDVHTGFTIPAYGTVLEGNRYFDQVLGGEVWFDSDDDKRRRALISATKLINNLNFSGYKTDPLQQLDFPRNGSTIVPNAIKEATYIIAARLLDGVEAEIEATNLSVISQGYGSVRTTYDRTSPADYLLAGIPSQQAWFLLRPYLIDPNQVNLSRVN